jgi:drug/metabolite transporter (DMT)-like permease
MSRGWIALAFGVVYLVWGSTYLAIRVGVETIPPFLMSGTRFLAAGGLMLAFLRLRGAAWPTAPQWRNGFIAGTLMLLGGNAIVGLAEKQVASNIAALMIAATPAWFAILNWVRPGGSAPSRRVALGILVGFSGVAWLVGHRGGGAGQGAAFSLLGAGTLISASILWASGSLFVKHSEKPASPFVAAAVQMLAGGIVVSLVSWGLGEMQGFSLAQVSSRSAWAWVYLIGFGSWLGYSAYNYLLTHVSAAAVSTYAFVNPIVAVALGWWLANEAFDPRMLAAAMLIVVGVVIITWPARSPALPRPSV